MSTSNKTWDKKELITVNIPSEDDRAEQYTTATGSYRGWSVDVDLGPPRSSTPVPPEDKHIVNYYDALQYSLFENNLPETEDRTATPQRGFTKNDVCVAILSSPVECMSILLEGGVQCPRDMLLVMSCTWVMKKISNKNPKLFSLYVSKAISFDSGRRTYLDVFDPPRRVTYFMNFFTRAVTDGQRSDGEILENELDCPMSSSLNLVKIVDDKVWTRLIAAKVKADYPETLAIVYKSTVSLPSFGDITVVNIDSKTGVENMILDELQTFLNGEVFDTCRKIVVKPSGHMWHGSLGVSFHDSDDVNEIWEAVLVLLSRVEDGDSVLVETFYSPPPPKSSRDEYSFRLRANVCRDIADQPIMTTIICGVGMKNSPINGDNTIPQTFATTLRHWGVTEDDEVKRLHDLVKVSSESIMRGIMEIEKNMTAEDRGGVGGQTDVIGVDYVLGSKNGFVVPVMIEVNSHDCTINCQLFEFMNPALMGSSVGPLVATMVHRSQKYIMQEKTILLIGAGGHSKRFVWDATKEYDIKIILIDEHKNSYAKERVHKFLHYNYTDHTQDELHANNIIQLLSSANLLPVDGCCTIWEDNGPLSASICAKLKLFGSGQTSAKIAKMKSWTHKKLLTRTADIPHFPRTYLYASPCVHINSSEDIGKALHEVGLPAVLKLEYGSSAIGVKIVHNIDQCQDEYKRLQSKLQEENDHPGIGLGHGNSMMLMQYLEGTEHDVDIIIYRRRFVDAYISDNGPTREGRCTETAACMPSCLSEDKKAQLVTAAYQCCTEIGLENGVFNVEMKMTLSGPKLVEINARMGGFYLRDWIKACYGVDLLLCNFMISSGIRPILPKSKPRFHIMGVMCVPSAHRNILIDPEFKIQLKEMVSKTNIRYNEIEDEMESDEETEEPICNVAVEDDDMEKAKAKLLIICHQLRIDCETYSVKKLISQFSDIQ